MRRLCLGTGVSEMGICEEDIKEKEEGIGSGVDE